VAIQRRHQKLVEESPSVAISAESRRRMLAAAASGAQACGYENAGTVEFLVDKDGSFYFLEVNARLQVEHPVTELCTGLDLVADQIRVAAGEPLPYGQEDIHPTGHAIECRISAEDPYNNFLPSLGRMDLVEEPAGPGVRVDSSLWSGVEIPYHYDPMLAKLICWGPTREVAIQRMLRALREYVIVGVQTNIPFHQQLLTDKRFLAAEFHTNWLEQEFTMASPDGHPDEQAALLVAAVLAHLKKRQPLQVDSGRAGSSWGAEGRARALRAGELAQRRGWR
jgi:acetyl-CoA carboxylase biotin carboxylase subunit